MPASTKEIKYTSTAADELDDGLDYEVASSNDEAEAVLLDEDENEESIDKIPEVENSKKRKPEVKDKLHNKKKQKMEFDCEQKKLLSLATPELIAEKLASKVAQQNKDLSPLELGELYIGKSFIKSSSDFTEDRTLDNLSKFITSKFQEMLPKNEPLKKKKKKNPKKQDKVAKELAKKQLELDQAKHFITVVSMSAIRACDIHRATKELGSIKLIKKNKIKDDLEILDKSGSRILATTPNRMLRLLSEPETTINDKNIKVIIIDNSYLDSKKQNILDIAGTITFLRKICDNNKEVNIYLY